MDIHEKPNEGYGRTKRQSINSFLSQKRKLKTQNGSKHYI